MHADRSGPHGWEDVGVSDTSARLLRLLSLLQRQAHWSGPALAERLEVTTRTVRRDVDRLRGLGYPVEAGPGVAGGYRLGIGAALPPLLLDDEEATAIAVALGVSTGGAVRGIEQPALAALAKLDRVLPVRLRQRVDALRSSVVTMAPEGDEVDADLLVALAQACEGHERVTITYRDREGRESERRTEPYRLVSTGRRWYLLADDVDRRDWRTFRVDRITGATRTGHRFTPRDPPDAAAMVSRAITTAPYRHQAVVRFDAPAQLLAARIPPTVGTVRPDRGGSILSVGADDLAYLAGHLIGLDLPFEVLEPTELRDHLDLVGRRLTAAHGSGTARP
jgi:predicted DNA-binding transcriptional regulator YafY